MRMTAGSLGGSRPGGRERHAFGHLVIKMSAHPPFGAQVILNGHEYVAVATHDEGIGFTKEENRFTEIAIRQRLARVADAWRLRGSKKVRGSAVCASR